MSYDASQSLKIGITQGCREYPDRNEIRDELDQNWTVIADSINAQLIPIPNKLHNPMAWIESLNLDGIILSGGGDYFQAPNDLNFYADKALESLSAQELRCRTEASAITLAKKKNLKLLGICRGMQLINSNQGGKIQPIKNHVGLSHKIEFTSNIRSLNAKLPSIVNSFHEYGILDSHLGENLIAVAMSGDYVEMFVDDSLRVLGIMWHPERSADTDVSCQELLLKFFNSNLYFLTT